MDRDTFIFTDEELEYKLQLDEYIKSIPEGQLAKLIHGFPGTGWRIIVMEEMAKNTGHKIPSRIQDSIDKEEKFLKLRTRT